PEKRVVNHSRLCEVGNLGGPAGVGKRRQQVILHHWPQQHVGTEIMRRSGNSAQQFGPGKLLFLNHKLRVLRTAVCSMVHRHACAISNIKDQCGRWRDLDLLMIAGRFERFATSQQRVVEFRGTIDSSVENGFDYGVQFGMGGINLNHAPLCEKAAEQTSERAAQALAGTITLAQKTCGFRVAQKFTGSFHNRASARSETSNALLSFGRRIPSLVLALENGGNALPSARVISQCRCFVFQPFMNVRRPGIELLHLGKIVEEVGEKPGSMRDLAERQTLRFHRRFSRHRWMEAFMRWSTPAILHAGCCTSDAGTDGRMQKKNEN